MIDPAERSSSLLDLNENIYGRIFSMFPNLVDLHLICDSFWRQHPRLVISYLPPIKSFLPNIIHLSINVDTWDDCLYLLDGRLVFLRTLRVRVCQIQTTTTDITTTVGILALFSLAE